MNRALSIWLLFLLALSGSAVAQTLDLTRTRIPGGGGPSAGGQFTLFSTLGQAEAGPRMAGGAFKLDAGFLSATIPSEVPTLFFPQGAVTVLEDAGLQTRSTFVVFEPGLAGEPAQPPTYVLSNNNPALFSAAPAIGTNRTMTFTPAAHANGSTIVTVVVRVSGADVATNTFSISVTPVNDAPSVVLAGDVTVLEDAGTQAITGFAVFNAGPADEVTQTPTYTLTAANPALFSAQPAIAANGTLTFKPATNANGSATITVVTADDGGTASGGADRTTNTFTITVTAVNDQPAVTSAMNNVVVLEDAGAQTVSGFAAFAPGPADEAAQTASYALTPSNPVLFSAPPTINASGTLTFTTAVNANGSALVTVVVQDSGGTAGGGVDKATNSFTITVTAVNDQPSVAYATNNVVVLEDAGPQLLGGFATFTAGPADESTQSPAYTLAANNTALFSQQPAIAPDGTLTFTPAANANGSAIVSVVVADNGGTDNGGVDRNTNTFTITVTAVNDQPSVIYAMNNVVVLEDAGPQTLSGHATFTAGPADESAQTAAYTLTVGNAGLFSAPPAIAPNGTLTFTAAANANGFTTVTVVVQDSGGTGGGGVDKLTNTFSITVTAVNDAPSVAFATNNVIAVKDTGAQTATGFATFTAGPADESAQTAAYTLTADNAALFSVQPAIAANGTLTFTPAAGAEGIATMTVVAQDTGGTANGGSDKATNTFGITVVPFSTAPDNYSVSEDRLLTVAAAAGVLANDVGVGLGVRLVDAPTNGAVTLNANGSFTYQPAANFYGTDTFTYKATNSLVASLPTAVTILVSLVNDAPAAAYLTNEVVVLEDAGAQSLMGFATFSPGPANESAQTLMGYTVSNSSSALFSVQPAVDGTGRLTFTPATNANGSATVTVVVQDSGGTNDSGVDRATNSFTIAVASVNDAPTLAAIENPTAILEDAAQQTVNLAGISAGGGESQTLRVTAMSSNPDLIPKPTVTYTRLSEIGSLRYKPVANANGTAVITVTVTDDGGTANGGVDTTTRQFTVTVTAVNDAPVANNDSYPMSQGDVLTVAAAGVLANDTDVEGNPLTAAKLTNPSHGTLAFNANGGFTYTPETSFYGVDSFTYRANDGTDNSAPGTVSLTVLARPVVTPPPGKQRVFTSAALRFSATNAPDINAVRVSDPDSTELTLTLTVTNGTLAVTVTNGLALPNGFTNTNTLVLAGPITSLNAALESLAYRSVTNYFGDDTLLLVAQDEGGRTNRGNGTVSILVEVPALGGLPQVSLEGLNDRTTGRMITNVTAVTMDTNLVEGITFDATNNVVNVLPVGGQDGSTNRSTLTVLARFNDGSTQLVTVPVIIYQPLLTRATNQGSYNSSFGSPLFNPQTSLYEQKVSVVNNTPFDFTALRLTATNLPATVTLQNATLTNGGRAYIDYNLTVRSGSNVTLKVEYFSSDLQPFTPGLKLELLNQQRTTTAPTNFTMTAVAAQRNGYDPDRLVKNYLKFPTQAGQLYYVQYQEVAGSTWLTSPVVITGTGRIYNWIDDGPPNTETAPGPARFYRVVTNR
ncbi:MAG: tandem-95 repeat protein [Verrucomicrobia bacterium]|nr:tandem-95 repeat protein [Verrucomicrobiota bacterium]